MTDREALIALNLTPGIGTRTIDKLLQAVEHPSELCDMRAPAIRERTGLPTSKAVAVAQSLDGKAVKEELARAAQEGVSVISRADPGYPEPLLRMTDPPIVLYIKGEYRPTDGVALAVVGARRASHFGIQTATRLAGKLATIGFTIVSGLARGIDAAAHRGALAAGGRTIAVCGAGLATIYPSEHEDLAGQVGRNGALISEFPMEFPVRADNFPRRNRIISGLCLGVVVVEASKRSGSLITARLAGEQGKEVFAVPGRAGNPLSQGAHRLIKDGAKLVDDVDDVLEEFPEVAAALLRPRGEALEGSEPTDELGETERAILEALDDDPAHPETLAARTQKPIRDVLAALSKLSLLKLATALPGGTWVRRS